MNDLYIFINYKENKIFIKLIFIEGYMHRVENRRFIEKFVFYT